MAAGYDISASMSTSSSAQTSSANRIGVGPSGSGAINFNSSPFWANQSAGPNWTILALVAGLVLAIYFWRK